MWKIKENGKDLQMNKGDFGLPLPINITNTLETDKVEFEIYNLKQEEILKKDLLNEKGKFILELTKDDSSKLEETTYMYKLVQYRDDILQNTINENSLFEVV